MRVGGAAMGAIVRKELLSNNLQSVVVREQFVDSTTRFNKDVFGTQTQIPSRHLSDLTH